MSRADQDAIRLRLETELAALAELDRRRHDGLLRIEDLRSQLFSPKPPAEGGSPGRPLAAGTPVGPASAADLPAFFGPIIPGEQRPRASLLNSRS
jgi:hypothetical protein